MAIRESITIDDALQYLNDLAELAPTAIRRLLYLRMSCNEALADHPSCQVGVDVDGTFDVGPFGILAGLFGADDGVWPAICFSVKENGRPVFMRLTEEMKDVEDDPWFSG